MKSSPSFFSAGFEDFDSRNAAPSPFFMISSSTCISCIRQCKVEIIITSAAWTSHFRARRKRRRSASGWSCLDIDQKASRKDSGDCEASACLNSCVCPCLSLSPSAMLLVSLSAPLSLSFLWKRDSLLFFRFFWSPVGGSNDGVEVPLACSSRPLPKMSSTCNHISFSFAS